MRAKASLCASNHISSLKRRDLFFFFLVLFYFKSGFIMYISCINAPWLWRTAKLDCTILSHEGKT